MRRYKVRRDDGLPFGDGSMAACFDARGPQEAARIAMSNDREAKAIPHGAVLIVRLAESRRAVVNHYRVIDEGHADEELAG